MNRKNISFRYRVWNFNVEFLEVDEGSNLEPRDSQASIEVLLRILPYKFRFRHRNQWSYFHMKWLSLWVKSKNIVLKRKVLKKIFP